MTPLSAYAALALSPDRAADLVRVLDLQAAWESHRDDRAAGDGHGPALRERQRRYDAFRAAQVGSAGLRAIDLPEAGGLGSPERLAGWCRAVVAACRRAREQAGVPAALLGKAYRLADRIAARLKADPVGRDGDRPVDGEGAVARLEAVVAWCDGLVPARGLARPGTTQAAGGAPAAAATLPYAAPLARQAA